MELAWHTQKNQMSDVKGKEKEQEREGEIKNEDIDLSRTKYNFDIVNSELNLYQRVKERVTYAKENGSRVQKNSVVMYSNILTVPEDTAKMWGDEKTARYFEACYEYFGNEFGKENVVGAKVHLDETTPHMHLHFVPFNKDTGKLQARVAMNKAKINHIHNSLPAFLQEKGFDVVRGSGKTKGKNIEDVHEYKEVVRAIDAVKTERDQLQADYENKKTVMNTDLGLLGVVLSETENKFLALTHDVSEKEDDKQILESELLRLAGQVQKKREEDEREAERLKQNREEIATSEGELAELRSKIISAGKTLELAKSDSKEIQQLSNNILSPLEVDMDDLRRLKAVVGSLYDSDDSEGEYEVLEREDGKYVLVAEDKFDNLTEMVDLSVENFEERHKLALQFKEVFGKWTESKLQSLAHFKEKLNIEKERDGLIEEKINYLDQLITANDKKSLYQNFIHNHGYNEKYATWEAEVLRRQKLKKNNVEVSKQKIKTKDTDLEL